MGEKKGKLSGCGSVCRWNVWDFFPIAKYGQSRNYFTKKAGLWTRLSCLWLANGGWGLLLFALICRLPRTGADSPLCWTTGDRRAVSFRRALCSSSQRQKSRGCSPRP